MTASITIALACNCSAEKRVTVGGWELASGWADISWGGIGWEGIYKHKKKKKLNFRFTQIRFIGTHKKENAFLAFDEFWYFWFTQIR